MILKKYSFSNRHEYLRALWDLNLQNVCFVRAIYLHLQDVGVLETSLEKRKKEIEMNPQITLVAL